MSDQEFPDDINAQITRGYQKRFDECIYACKLDIEYDNWLPQVEANLKTYTRDSGDFESWIRIRRNGSSS